MAPQDPPGLMTLPVELLTAICSHLCPHCCDTRPGWVDLKSQPALSRLSRTCKHLRDIAQPILFHSFYTDGRIPGARLARLIRTLRTQQPDNDLGRHVKFLGFHDPHYQDELTLADREFIESTVTGLGLSPLHPSWHTTGDPETHLLLIQLVLLSTPNLATLHIPFDYDWQLLILEHHLSKCTNDNLNKKPLLPHLKTLDISHFFIAGDRFDICTSQVTTFAALAPNIETLLLPSPSGSFIKPMPRLRQLILGPSSHLAPETLTELFTLSPNLEVFALHWDALADPYDFTEDRTAADIWDVLSVRKDTLREVSIDVQTFLETGAVSWWSLREFPRLEVLRVDGTALRVLRTVWEGENLHARVDSFLSGGLPAGIKELVLWRPDGGLVEAVKRLARTAALGRFKELKRVMVAPGLRTERWGDSWDDQGEWIAAGEELGTEFRKGGVRFEIKGESGFWWNQDFV